MFQKRKAQKHGLYIIIIGCGKVGVTLTEHLSKEGHDITIIDQNEERVQEIAGIYDVMGVVGNGASYSIQMEAGITDADLLIAVTASDELNLLCCTIAKQVGDCSTIARVRTPDYSKEAAYLREKLGLAMIINPEFEAAREASRILSLPTALEVTPFAHGLAEMIKFKVPKDNFIDGMTVAELGMSKTTNIHICAIERDNQVHIPSGNFKIAAGDVVIFITSHKVAKAFFKDIGFKTNQVKSTMIVGGGTAAYYLSLMLLNLGVSVKIIEKDRKRCEELSMLLPNAVIINGDGTDQALLDEEGIHYTNAFVPLTGIDEENIMLTLYARHVSSAKVITKINRITFKDVINNLDLGSVIYPKSLAAEAIVAYVRAKSASQQHSEVETLYHMFDSKAEAVEFNVKEDSAVTNIPLKDLELKENLLVSLICREGKIIFPGGNDYIQVGDTVMIVTTYTGLANIQDILK